MAETLSEQAAVLSAQLTYYLPPERAESLAQVLTALRAGVIDASRAEEALMNNGDLADAVHQLGNHAVAIASDDGADGFLFDKDADLHTTLITIGTVMRQASSEYNEGDFITTARLVFHIPIQTTEPLVFQPPYSSEQQVAGRDVLLQWLADRLLTNEPSVSPLILAGPAGSGKRCAAATFAHLHRAAFPGGIFWLRMGDTDDFSLQIAQCGGPKGMNLPGWVSLPLAAQVSAVYAAWQEPTPRLLVFEGMIDSAQLVRWSPVGGGCRVLAVAERWPNKHDTLFIDALPRPASYQLLLKRYATLHNTTVSLLLGDTAELSVTNAICDELGDMPLALELAEAVLAAHPDRSLSSYFGSLVQITRAHTALLRRWRASVSNEASGKIGAAVLLSLELLHSYGSVGSVAECLLRRAARCAPAPLPGDLLPQLIGATTESGAAWSDATAALQLLLRLRLCTVQNHYLFVHPVVAHFAQTALTSDADEEGAIERALIGSVLAAHKGSGRQPNEALLPHLMLLVKRVEQRNDDQAATLLLHTGYLLERLRDLDRARPLYERTLAICQTLLGEDHAATARIAVNIGRLHEAQGNNAQAQHYYEQALAIHERLHGPTAPPTARMLHRLGELFERHGDLDEARDCYERALAINEHTFGIEHPDTASSMMMLGHVIQQQGEYSQARNLYERALEVCDQLLGTNHPATARTLHGLGLVCEQQGDLWSAQRCHERALAIREQIFGAQHADTARSLHTLAYVLHLGDQFELARTYYERALAVRETVLGSQHPDTASTLNNLGHLCEMEGDFLAAQGLYQRALHICMQALGAEHPHTEVVRKNLVEVAAHLRDR